MTGDGADPARAPQLAAHLFRRHGARLVARLAAALGPRHLALAEDAVQDALVAALEHWPFDGVPARPEAWLTTVARRRALDRLRSADAAAVRGVEELDLGASEAGAPVDALDDAQLALLFACAHPDLGRGAQVAFTLRVACGLGTDEIARALQLPRATVQQRIVRAKRLLAARPDALSLPEGAALGPRLAAVHEALYATFSEGYLATAGEIAVRVDLQDEALRLTALLATHPRGDVPEGHALLALMYFHAARSRTRLDAEGDLLLLGDQDRGAWDRERIAAGFDALAAARHGERLSRWHVEAGIAASHAGAPSLAATDWSQVVALYDLLLEGWPTPVAALNRAVAVGERDGPAAGLAALRGAAALDPELERGHLVHAVRGALHERCGDRDAALAAYEEALARPATEAEQRLLERRLGRLRSA